MELNKRIMVMSVFVNIKNIDYSFDFQAIKQNVTTYWFKYFHSNLQLKLLHL